MKKNKILILLLNLPIAGNAMFSRAIATGQAILHHVSQANTNLRRTIMDSEINQLVEYRDILLKAAQTTKNEIVDFQNNLSQNSRRRTEAMDLLKNTKASLSIAPLFYSFQTNQNDRLNSDIKDLIETIQYACYALEQLKLSRFPLTEKESEKLTQITVQAKEDILTEPFRQKGLAVLASLTHSNYRYIVKEKIEKINREESKIKIKNIISEVWTAIQITYTLTFATLIITSLLFN